MTIHVMLLVVCLINFFVYSYALVSHWLKEEYWWVLVSLFWVVSSFVVGILAVIIILGEG